MSHRPFASVIAAAIVTVTLTARIAHAVGFAAEVVDLNLGSSGFYTSGAAALGAPDGVTGQGFGFPSVLSPFSPAFDTDEILQISGEGATVTLRLSHYALPTAGLELGVVSNVGLSDSAYPSGQGTNPALPFSEPRQALVEVSDDGVSFVSLGTIVFDLPANYYTDIADPYQTTPGSTPADLGKPFDAALSDFDGLDYAGMKALLDGSIGGKWIDISASGLSQVGWVRFTTVADNGFDFVIDSLIVANDATGAAIAAVPTPTALAMTGVLLLTATTRRRRMR